MNFSDDGCAQAIEKEINGLISSFPPPNTIGDRNECSGQKQNGHCIYVP